MIDLESYIRYPCELLSIPYWKNKNLTLPDNMRIVHHKDFNAEYLKEYHDEEYFRLFHSLRSNANQRGIISVDIIPYFPNFTRLLFYDRGVIITETEFPGRVTVSFPSLTERMVLCGVINSFSR